MVLHNGKKVSHNTHITQYLIKQRQPENEICSVNRI